MNHLLPVACLLLATCAAAAPAERRLDSLVERAAAWKADRPDRVSATVLSGVGHGTPRSLMLEWAKDLGTVKDGLPSAPQVPSIWIGLPDDLDLALYTRLRLQVKIEGARHGFLHLALSNEPALWGAGVKAFISNVPLDAGPWQEIEIGLDLAPEEERRAMRWMGFASINVGHHSEEGPVLRTSIDDLVLSAAPPPQRRGWSADASQVIVSRLGFRPLHEKLAIVHDSKAGGRFEIRAAGTGAVVYSGTLSLVESALGRHAVADFSEWTSPGSYQVHAAGLSSLPFRIGDDASEPSLELLSDAVHGMRCGQATALHPACHLDDGLWLRPQGSPPGPERRQLPLAGGWHDAGDVRTYYSYSYQMAYRMLRARDSGWSRDRDGDGVDDLLDDARWALEHAVRLVDPLSGGLLDKIDDQLDFRRGNYWSDNRRGTADDRTVRIAPELGSHVASLAASAGLAARRALTDEDRRLAAAAVALAERRLAEWVAPPDPRRPPRFALEDQHGHVLARFGLGALELHLATGKPEHLLLARSCADAVLGLQGESFLPGALRPLGGDIFPWSLAVDDMDLPELFLAELLLGLPEDPDAARWRAALRRVADWWMKPTRELWGPFSLPSRFVPERELVEGGVAVKVSESTGNAGARFLVPSAGPLQLADTALALQRLAQALEDPELERLARRQLHWAFGYNPFGVSWVALHDDRSIEQMYSFAQGRIAGAVAGYGIGKDGVPACGRPAGAEPVTHAAAELLAAAIAVTEPSRWSLRLEEGGAPWTGEVTLSWTRTGRVIATLRTDADGRLPEFQLDGGERYLLSAGSTRIPLVAISGRRVERSLDLGRRLELSAAVHQRTYQSQRFTVAVTARNTGTRRLATTVRLDAAAVFPRQAEWAIELEPGESVSINWPLHAKTAGRAWALDFQADGTDARAELSGVTLRPEPPAAAR